ncbi:MAG: hypothetical protein AAGD09_20435 [Cyanobacteria bacterium P01_F01_bin.56]
MNSQRVTVTFLLTTVILSLEAIFSGSLSYQEVAAQPVNQDQFRVFSPDRLIAQTSNSDDQIDALGAQIGALQEEIGQLRQTLDICENVIEQSEPEILNSLSGEYPECLQVFNQAESLYDRVLSLETEIDTLEDSEDRDIAARFIEELKSELLSLGDRAVFVFEAFSWRGNESEPPTAPPPDLPTDPPPEQSPPVDPNTQEPDPARPPSPIETEPSPPTITNETPDADLEASNTQEPTPDDSSQSLAEDTGEAPLNNDTLSESEDIAALPAETRESSPFPWWIVALSLLLAGIGIATATQRQARKRRDNPSNPPPDLTVRFEGQPDLGIQTVNTPKSLKVNFNIKFIPEIDMGQQQIEVAEALIASSDPAGRH